LWTSGRWNEQALPAAEFDSPVLCALIQFTFNNFLN
jgi:hypothetical protein